MQKKIFIENTTKEVVLKKVLLYFITQNPDIDLVLEGEKKVAYTLYVKENKKINISLDGSGTVVFFDNVKENFISDIVSFINLQELKNVNIKYLNNGQVNLSFDNFVLNQNSFKQEKLEKILNNTMFTISKYCKQNNSINLCVKTKSIKHNISINISKKLKLNVSSKVNSYFLQLLNILLYYTCDVSNIKENKQIFDKNISIITKEAKEKTIQNMDKCEVVKIKSNQGQVISKSKKIDYKDLSVFIPQTEIEKQEEILLKKYLPYSYLYHTKLNYRIMLLQIIEDSKVEKDYYDYSQLAFTALRALEGHLTYTLSHYIECTSINKSIGTFFSLSKNKISEFIYNEEIVNHLIDTFNYFKKERHNLFHCPNEENIEEIRILDNLLDTKIIILNCLKFIDYYYKLLNSNT